MATSTTINDIINTWYPDKRDLVKWVYDLAKYLQDHPIPAEDTLQTIIDQYLTEHPIDVPVKTVNGQSGDVVLTADNVGALSTDGGVLDGDLSVVVNNAQILLTATNDGKAIIILNGQNATDSRSGITTADDGHLQLRIGETVYTLYDSGNLPTQGAPVQSVNGETGNVYVDRLYDTYPTTAFSATSDNTEASATWEFAGSTQTLKIDTAGKVTANGVAQFSPQNFPAVHILEVIEGGATVTLQKGINKIYVKPKDGLAIFTESYTIRLTSNLSENNWLWFLTGNAQSGIVNVAPINNTNADIKVYAMSTAQVYLYRIMFVVYMPDDGVTLTATSV